MNVVFVTPGLNVNAPVTTTELFQAGAKESV